MNAKYLFAAICAMASGITIAALTQTTAWNWQDQYVYANSMENKNMAEADAAAKNIQQWEKFDFMIASPETAAKLGVNPNTELNVKILGNSSSVEDMRQAVLDSFKKNVTTTQADKDSIHILGTLNDVICAK